MVVAEISAGYNALKTAMEIAKGLKDIHDQVKLNSAVIDLQGQILAAQEAAQIAREKVAEIEAQLQDLLDWKAVAQRYQLKDFGGKTFAYELKADVADGEPIHRACPKCFENRRRSILQFDFKDISQRDHYKCHGCDSQYEFGIAIRPEPQRAHGTDYNPFS